MTDLLDLLVLQGVFSWSLIAITLFGIVVMPRLFGLNYFNGLSYSQFTLFFNATAIIAGLDSELVGAYGGLHFYIIEFVFLALTFAIYRHFLTHRARVFFAMRGFFGGKGALLIVTFVVGMAVFNFLLAPTDGSSRIAYMTEVWFSLIKPFFQVVIPVSYLGVFIMLQNPSRRRLGYILLVAIVIANIATGSKASFAIGLLSALLMLRDISGPSQFTVRRQDLIKFALFFCAAIVFSLARLEVSIDDIFDRFFLFGEATILTYFSDAPTAACANVSTFASMHRGLARLLGDASAQDIDTLFGYALTIEKLGVNTFTGPNGRLSAYILCNFSDEQVVLGVFVVLFYFLLIIMLFKQILNRPIYLALIYPFMLTSLGGAAQDFNLIMQDITIISILIFLAFLYYIVPARRQLE